MGAPEASIKMEMEKDEEQEVKKAEGGKNWRAWLGEGIFYIYGMVYMMVRIAINVTMTI